MASNSILASMAVALTANVSDFQRGMAAAKKELAGFKKAGEQMKDFGENLSKYISAPLAGIAAVSLKTFGDIQALQKGLVAVAGSAEAADTQFKNLKEVAKLPGLGLEEAIQGSINLQAAGFSASQAEGALKGFGNALATVGKGKAELDGVTTALSQMAAKGKISAEEVNQIAERVPQIRKVMAQAFGTSNTEELQKMGISANEFIDKVTAELSKLPPVSGGLINSFENLADSGKLAFATLGESISKTFNIEGFLNGIADKLTSLAEGFSNLSPFLQRFIVIGGGIVAAAGPLLLAFGAISAAIPTIVAGATMLGAAFAAITGPMALVAAGVAAAAALIIRNWDVIKAYFTTGGGATIFNKVKETALAAFNRISDIISGFVNLTQAIWERYGSTIIATAKLFLTPIVELFKGAFNIIGSILDFWRALFEGNWSKMWQSLSNITAIAINGIIDLIAGMATAIPRLLGTALSGLGIDNAFTAGLEKAVATVNSLANSFKLQTVEVYKSTAAVKDNAQGLGQVSLASDVATKSYERQAQALKGLRQHYKEHWAEMKVVADQYLREGLKLKVDLLPVKLKPFMGSLTQAEQIVANFSDNATQLINNLIVDGFVKLGEAIGSAIAGGSAQNFFDSFMMMLADFAAQFGKMLITVALAEAGLVESLKNPTMWPVALAAGVALTAAAGAAKAFLAKGIGGPSAPQSVSPNYNTGFDKNGNWNNQVEFQIKGDTLVGVLDRTGYRNRRFGG